MMKRFVASVAIVLAALSVAGAQEVCRQGGGSDLAGVIGSTVGALIGSTIGDGKGRTLAVGAGGLLGGLVGESLLPPRRPAVRRRHSLAQQLHDQRNQVIEAALSGRIPMPGKAGPVSRRQEPAPASNREFDRCREIEPGTFACRVSDGTWRIVR